MVLIAFAHALYQIVKLPALAARFAHDELLRASLNEIELEPFAPGRELHGQALIIRDQAEVLRQLYDRFPVDELGCATDIRPSLRAFKRDVDDLSGGIGGGILHEALAACGNEVPDHVQSCLRIYRPNADAVDDIYVLAGYVLGFL